MTSGLPSQRANVWISSSTMPSAVGAPSDRPGGRRARLARRGSSRTRSSRSRAGSGASRSADADRAARARGRLVDGLLAENAGRWEALVERDASAWRRWRARSSSGCCTSRPTRVRVARRRGSPRAAAAAARAVRTRRGGRGRRGRGRRGRRVRRLDTGSRLSRTPASPKSPARVTALRLGTRGSALALAQARAWRALLGGDVELVKITTAGDVDRARGDKSRWVGRAGVRAAGGRDRPRGALGQGRPGRARARDGDRGDAAAGRAVRRAGRRGRAAPCARARGWGRARCAAAPSCSPCGRTSR